MCKLNEYNPAIKCYSLLILMRIENPANTHSHINIPYETGKGPQFSSLACIYACVYTKFRNAASGETRYLKAFAIHITFAAFPYSNIVALYLNHC